MHGCLVESVRTVSSDRHRRIALLFSPQWGKINLVDTFKGMTRLPPVILNGYDRRLMRIKFAVLTETKES
jgi:hypothetical protein